MTAEQLKQNLINIKLAEINATLSLNDNINTLADAMAKRAKSFSTNKATQDLSAALQKIHLSTKAAKDNIVEIITNLETYMESEDKNTKVLSDLIRHSQEVYCNYLILIKSSFFIAEKIAMEYSDDFNSNEIKQNTSDLYKKFIILCNAIDKIQPTDFKTI